MRSPKQFGLAKLLLIPIDYFVFKNKVSARAIFGTIIALAGVAFLFLIYASVRS